MRLPRPNLRLGLRLSRRTQLVLGGLVLVAGIGALAFGPLVRAEVAAQAAKRHLRVEVGGVRPGWFAVRLRDVVVRPEGVDSIQLRTDEARVGLSMGFHVDGIDLRGGSVDLEGSPDRIRDDWSRWRADRPTSQGNAGRVLPISVEGIALRWTDGDGRAPRAELHGMGARRDESGAHLHVDEGAVRFGRASVSLTAGDADIDPKGVLVRAHAASMVLELSPRPETRAENGPSDASSAGPPPLQVARTTRERPRGSAPPAAPIDPGAPILPLPDVRAERARAAAIAGLLSDRVPEGAGLSVDALTWKIASTPDRVALTIGPGPFALTRTASRFELRFSTDQQASSTSLSVRALLPTDPSDVSITLEGGPVSLSLLGIREGAAGLVDVDRATVTGRARVVLAGDGSALTFDAEGGARGLAIHQPKLAAEVVRGIDVGLRARGALSGGEVRLDDFGATFGALHLGGSGELDQEPDHVTASFRFELPSTACQSLLDSIPTALLPALQGTRIAGTFGAHGRFAFDTRSLDDLELEYDLQDRCKMVEVPDTLAPERFKASFEHRIYLPDGTTTDQETGPGTDNWTPLDEISPYMQVAVMTTEDGAFPKHHGFNRAAIRASIIANLKARRFVRGASTITMQLAKNLFLSRDKTLARKLEEVVLTDYLEQVFAKDELMELYLNVIEFGPAVYGITAAAEYYFGRTPAELNLAECLFLSSLLPAPLRYGAMREREQVPDGWLRTLRSLMEVAHKRGLITDAELAEGLNEPIVFWHGGDRPPPRPAAQARGRLDGSEDVDQPAIDMPADTP